MSVETSLPVRFFWVLGLPSGGTSCVAGILHHLGVNMGNIRERSKEAKRRPYYRYEDRGFKKVMRGTWPGPLLEPVCSPQEAFEKFEQYIQTRLSLMDGALGIKVIRTCYCGLDRRAASLPVYPIFVMRPIEESRASENRRYSDKPKRMGQNRVDRLDVIQMMIETFRYGVWNSLPHLEVSFGGVLQNPEEEVLRIRDALKLRSSDEQVQAAINHVERKT